jgi:hypothetical protein
MMRSLASLSAVLRALVLFTLLQGLALSQTSVTANSFGFECGLALGNCPNITWPIVQVPPLVRAWDMYISWGDVMTGWGGTTATYNWKDVDAWLEQWGAHDVPAVWYTAGWVPDIPGVAGGDCTQSAHGCNGPPADLSSGGSPSFTQFVKDFLAHCESGAHHYCVADYVRYWGIWNEPGSSHYWGGSQQQLYQLAAPAISFIKTNYPLITISGPELSNAGSFQTWMNGWTAQEVTRGLISQVYAVHIYLGDRPPEAKVSYITNMTCMNTGKGCTPTPGWSPLPTWITEAQYNNTSPYTCVLSDLDCAGLPARLQLIAQANFGAQGVFWYSYMLSIGNVPRSQGDYVAMERLLTGGTFPRPCGNNATTWTCEFIESSGAPALWVWTTDEDGASYTIPDGYSQYKDLHGNIVPIHSGDPLPVTVEPLMLDNQVNPGSQLAPPSHLRVLSVDLVSGHATGKKKKSLVAIRP